MASTAPGWTSLGGFASSEVRSPSSWSRSAVSATIRRFASVDEIPPAELKLAVGHLVTDARRVSRDELTFEVARLCGWNRRGPDIAAALEGAVDALVRDGTLRISVHHRASR